MDMLTRNRTKLYRKVKSTGMPQAGTRLNEWINKLSVQQIENKKNEKEPDRENEELQYSGSNEASSTNALKSSK